MSASLPFCVGILEVMSEESNKESRSTTMEKEASSPTSLETKNIKSEYKHLPTCRLCYQSFDRALNNVKACRYHPESFTGETAQRWMDPGDEKGGAQIFNFYSCCGGKQDSPGCCYSAHKSFDDPEDFGFRRPGMGVDDSR